MRFARPSLVVILVALGVSKALSIREDNVDHSLIYAAAAITEIALAFGLLSKSLRVSAVWIGAFGFLGAAVGTLWSIATSDEPTACRCLGVVDTASSTAFVFLGAIVLLFGLSLIQLGKEQDRIRP